jgi:hypothetical protein
MNFIDLLFWQVCILIIIRLVRTDNPKLWVPFGIVAGVGLQNKVSLLLLVFGLGIGVLLTKLRQARFSIQEIWPTEKEFI